jgi:mannose-6-phosphate isomerase-like protein (cupin superfamily)
MIVRGEDTPNVECVTWDGRPLAYIVRASYAPDRTSFLTRPDDTLQAGHVVYPAGGEIQRHVHKRLERHIVGTSEALVVKRGHCWIDVYNDDRDLVASRELHAGDLMLMLGGGHGFRMIEDTVLIEIKQGPYTGIDEKERF